MQRHLRSNLNTIRAAALAGAGLAAFIAHAPAIAAEAEAAAAPASAEVEEITVTARYRNETVQDVPIGISAISGGQFERQGATTLKQVLQQLPSLNIQGFSGRNQTITVRGIGTNAGGTNDGLEQGVGLYVDGVYRPRTGSVITDLPDVESIQLLRGPQGTLFGKNTVAGALDIKTREPVLDQEIQAELSYGNHDYLRGYVALNSTLNDDVAFRISYLRTQRDGLIYNTRYREDWDNLDNHTAKFDLLYKPSEDFKLRFIADYGIQKGDVGFQIVSGVLPTTLANGAVVRSFYDRAAAVGYTPIAIDPFARRTDIDSSQYDKMPSWGLQARADWNVGPVSLTSITAYRNWKWIPNYDGDQIGANVVDFSVVDTKQQQFSQELRLASNGNNTIDYTAGLYFFWQEANDRSIQIYGRDASGWLLAPSNPVAALPGALDGVTAYAKVIPATYSYAGYGQATWNVSPAFRVTGGLRFTYEHKTGVYDADLRGDLAPIGSFAPALQASIAALRAAYAPTASYKASKNTNNLSGTLIAAYDLTPDIHSYASYSRGYKSPGINLIRQTPGVDIFVKPEKVDSYELGLKTRFLGGKAEVNLALFWMDVGNYQANYINNSVSPAVSYITNVGDVRSKGVELDARLQPFDGFSIGLAGTYNDAEYRSYTSAPAQYLNSYLGSIDLSGRRASGAPRFSGTANAEYNFDVGNAQVYLGGDVSYRTGYYAAVNLDPYSWVGKSTLVGLHAGVKSPDERWELSAWVRNLFDEDYYNTKSVSGQFGVVLASLGDPRLFGITLRGKL
ncbi:TonB-dependent receptor [Sphingomonas sp. ID0503]|uniref:TonB-dependent receptor n=1 Tax=Sphingomonas sp. ID0503 TaxID=3399691 RepID=UPI003AFB12AD